MDCWEYVLPRMGVVVCFAGLVIVYSIYYFVFVVGPPRVVCSDERRLRALRERCPVLFQSYWPTVWAPQAHVQTVLRELTQVSPRCRATGRREVLRLEDEGHVCLDWYNEGGEEERERGRRGGEEGREVDPHRPTVLILPGMTGSSDETYIRHWVDDITQLGYRSVVLNYRGCGNTTLSTPKMYALGDVSDLTEVIDHIHSSLPLSPLVAIGTSMGSNQLLTYVSQQQCHGSHCPLVAVLVFSVIWNTREADKLLHGNAFNRHILSRFLTFRFKSILKRNQSVFDECRERGELNFDFEAGMKSNNLQQLSEAVIVHMFDYQDNDHLHNCSSPSLHSHLLSLPILAVNSADDPFCPPHAIPEEVARGNPHLILATTRRGGHIAFLSGLLPFYKNYMDTVVVQFLEAVLKHHIFTDNDLWSEIT